MPFNFQRIVIESGVIAVLQIIHEGTERRIGYKFVIRIILLFISSQTVNLISFCLIEYHSLKTSEIDISEFIF